MKQYYLDICKQNFNMMGPNTLRLLEEQFSKLDINTKGSRVLDLGCGKALSSLYLAKEKQANVIAVDLWISATDNYRNIKEWGMEENIVPIHSDANDLPFANEYFDMIVSIDAYHYFGAKKDFFKDKILPLVKPGGFVVLAFPGIKNEFEGTQSELMNEWCGEELAFFHSVKWWEDLLHNEGQLSMLKVEEMDCFDTAWQEWFETTHEYAIRDKEFFDRGIAKYINFISVIIKKE